MAIMVSKKEMIIHFDLHGANLMALVHCMVCSPGEYYQQVLPKSASPAPEALFQRIFLTLSFCQFNAEVGR
jgi:hypothetical protein